MVPFSIILVGEFSIIIYSLGEEISVIDIAEAIGECVLKYVYDKYIISKAKNGAIAVSKNVSKKRLNTTGTLHSICKEMNIKYTKTTTNTELGKKIIEFINSNS